MDAPANNVVAPCLVVVSVNFLRQDGHTFLDARPLRVRSDAPLLGDSTDLLDALDLVLRICCEGACSTLDPAVEIRDPRVVFEDRSVLIKLPKRHLEGVRQPTE